jgi:hypothetical protein
MIAAIKLMENITAHWQQIQKAFRQGYVMNSGSATMPLACMHWILPWHTLSL